MIFNQQSAENFLTYTDIFFDDEEGTEFDKFTINLNDTWGWGEGDCEKVPKEDLVEVAELFWRYGWCGILYWVSKKRGGCESEFYDINRFIDFVSAEEKLRQDVPDSSKRAYTNLVYRLPAILDNNLT